MKQKLLSTTIAVLCTTASYAQQFGNTCCLPNVYLPPNVLLCDPNPYKLVFYDDFDGAQLKAPWITFNSWASMPGGDNDNWSDGRKAASNTIVRDANVIVGGGICRLYAKKETGTWKCNSCPESERVNGDYTVSALALPYTGWSFNSGKFEARISFPNFKGFWGAFWLWYGSCINEIDIAEVVGANKAWPFLVSKATAKVTHDLHAWSPRYTCGYDPYSLVEDADLSNEYPNQSWRDFLLEHNFHQNNWHTYTCEWDTAVIRNYLDGTAVSEIWKYYRERTVHRWPFVYHYLDGSGCNPGDGDWKVTYGFPYNNQSISQLRITNYIETGNRAPDMSGTLGEIDVDYVKVWQRHPEADGHTDICPTPQLQVAGPDIICSNSTADYTLGGQGVPNMKWTVSDGIKIQSVNEHGYAQLDGAGPDQGTITCTYGAAGCPVMTATKTVDLGAPATPIIICVKRVLGNQFGFNLSAMRNSGGGYNSATTFDWTIKYGTNYAYTYSAQGQSITTPYLLHNDGSNPSMKWTLKITNACGTSEIQGTQNINTSMMPKPASQMTDESPMVFLRAELPDSLTYYQPVFNKVEKLMVSSELNEIAVLSKISEIEMDELGQYIVFDDEKSPEDPQARGTNTSNTSTETKIFPNPTNGSAYIIPGKSFTENKKLSLTVRDMFGRVAFGQMLSFERGTKIDVDFSSLPHSVYSITLEQHGYKEILKLNKQ